MAATARVACRPAFVGKSARPARYHLPPFSRSRGAPAFSREQTPGGGGPHVDFRSALGHAGLPGRGTARIFEKHEVRDAVPRGDIVDGWQLRRQWYCPQAHNDVVQKLLRTARKGTLVIFIPGNHDEFARRYVGHDFGGIEVAQDWVHETAAGRKLWVTHGDRLRRGDRVRKVAGACHLSGVGCASSSCNTWFCRVTRVCIPA